MAEAVHLLMVKHMAVANLKKEAKPANKRVKKTKRKLKHVGTHKKKSKREYYSSSSSSCFDLDSEKDSGRYNTHISKSRWNVSKSENVQNANSVPIKFVETYPSYSNKVVKGATICATIVAVLYKHITNIEGLPPQAWWRTLLDRGSDSDLLVNTKIRMKNIPYEKRYTANTWQTPNGNFKTTHVGNSEMIFSAFSKSKISTICPDTGSDHINSKDIF